MSDFRTLNTRETAERILKFKSPVVLMHTHPDGDTVGSCSALIKIFRALGISAEYAVEGKIPDRLAFLLSGEKRTENFEEKELVAIDVASKSQLGTLAHLSEKVLLTIDHHAVSSPFSDNFTLADASSAGEVLFTVLEELIKMGKCSLNSEIAAPIYAAISSDTGGFLFSSATASTYRRAAELIESGIDFADINHRLFHSKSEKQLKAEGFISSKLKTALEGRISYASLSIKEREDMGLSSEHFETAIDIVRSVIFAQIAIFVRENDDGAIKASIRSTGFNVAEIAASFGGGGHVRAAGCTLPAKSAEEGAQIIINAIKDKLCL